MTHLQAELKEDVHEDTKFGKHVKEVLRRYNVQHDYPGKEWDGVERLCYELAKATPVLAVESPGWYRYESTKRKDMDGKDWRYVIPDPLEDGSAVVVNCHSLLHDDVWTLTTTSFSTNEVDLSKVRMLAHNDHWTRAFFWEMATAVVLEQDGYDYTKAVQDMQTRFLASQTLKQVADDMLPHLRKAFWRINQRGPDLRPLSVGVSEAVVLEGKVGRHEGPKDEVPYSILTIHPLALNNTEYLEQVLKHELIHFILGEEKTKDPHGSMFDDMAAELRLPQKYRD